MKFTLIDPPRVFDVGPDKEIRIKDCARIELQPDEQVTFVTESGSEYDVARKSWGFYATPSLNGRLASFGWRAALAKSSGAKYYLFLVEQGKESDFQAYLGSEGHVVICWLSSDDELCALEGKMSGQL